MSEPQILRREDDPHDAPPPMATRESSSPLFSPGQIVFSQGVAWDIEHGHLRGFQQFIRRHLNGDWGDIGAEDARENKLSLAKGYRIMSVYNLTAPNETGEQKLWIITEADRSATTLLYPSEY